ncbi:mucin-5AC-like [Cyclopterus lumpus]|uniref:mucin-5AC-like n=1 Tax=Cyclopterus lumpus TaxID=8103 RepID=UPI001486F633|nr:mucin-5AC-like [Cyclopterus lumpus]
MSPSLLLLLVSAVQASHFLGTVMTYYPKKLDASGTLTVVFRYKLNFHGCTHTDIWDCVSRNCGTQSPPEVNVVDQESSGEWCQKEGVVTRASLSSAPLQLQLSGVAWIRNNNLISRWKAVTLVELRTRSDTGRVNASPQTTILPALRVPSNCQRDFQLLAFDPDGDEVRCRYGNTTAAECSPCTPPSVLTLSSSCTLSFFPTSNEGPYAVQLVMEDFTRENIFLTQSNGSRTTLNAKVPISKLPVQFAFIVDPKVESCTEGLYLPKFLPPTPENRARLHSPVRQSLEISINAKANVSTVSELLFSGPHNLLNTSSGAGQYILRWTPSEEEHGESHPICFVVQAVSQSVKYHSELRCVIVTVGNGLTSPSTTTTSPSTNTTLSTTTTSPSTNTTLSTTTTSPSTNTTLSTTTTSPSTNTTPSTTTTPQTTNTTLSTTTTSPSTNTTLSTTTTSPSTNTTLSTTTTSPSTNTTLSTTTTSPSTNTTPSTTTTPQTTTTVVALRMRLVSSTPLSEDVIRSTVIQQIRDELVRLLSVTTVLIRSVPSTPTNTATPGGST